MYKLLLLILLFGFCYAQDSTEVTLKLGEVAKMRIDKQFDALITLRLEVQNTIILAKSQIEVSQEDLSRIKYAEFILKQLLDPPELEAKDATMNETN